MTRPRVANKAPKERFSWDRLSFDAASLKRSSGCGDAARLPHRVKRFHFRLMESGLKLSSGECAEDVCTSLLPKWPYDNKLDCVKSPLIGEGSNNILFQSSMQPCHSFGSDFSRWPNYIPE